MALPGRKTTILLNAVDVSSYFHSADFDVSVDALETSTYGNAWKTYIPGQATGALNTGGIYDPAFQPSVETLLGADPGQVLTYCPGGATAIGDRARLIRFMSSGYKETSPIGGVVGFTWAVGADAATGLGYMLSTVALGAQTPSVVTGANRNDGAASATGWTMHLHVTAVTGGSWVVKLVDSSQVGFGDVADVTGGAFTTAAAPTSQRLQSAATTTALRQYVRYVVTRTGGVAGDSITFALALARNA